MRSDRKRLLSGLPLASAVRHENDTSVQDGKTLLSNASPICRMSTASNASAMTDTESLCDSLSRTSLSILSSHSSEGECYFDASQILLELGKVDENENENDVWVLGSWTTAQTHAVPAVSTAGVLLKSIWVPQIGYRFPIYMVHLIRFPGNMTGTPKAFIGDSNFPT